ncbi:MAG: NFACT RNA binding domain-containing protein [Planctomycetota bacterium]
MSDTHRTSLSAAHVAELCAELQPLLAGWRVRDVQGFPPRDVLLIVEPEGDPGDGPPILRLRLAADPNAPRLHLQQGRVKKHDGPVGPFFQTLESELVGAKITRIAQVRGDRIVAVELRTEGREKRALFLELFGRRANLALTGAGDRLIALAVPEKLKKDREARLIVGEPWAPPGGGSGPRDAGPPIADAFPEPSNEPPGKVKDRAPLSWRVESALGAEAEVAHADEARRRLKSRVKRRIGRAEGLVKGLVAKADAAANAERLRQDGELAKAMLGTFQRGATELRVQDWFEDGAPERAIELDAKLSPQENVERLFDRYHKLVRAREHVDDELARARAKLTELEELARRAEDPDEDAEALDASAVEAGLLDRIQIADERKKKAPEPRKPYRVFTGSKGSEILVGRTSRDNDTLTIRIAKGSDLWLHTADCPGSHVVLRVAKGTSADEAEILDAAHLAIHFSPVRGTDRAPVHVCARKHVHKPKGAKPGLVTLSGGKTLQVRVEEDRLKRLLGGQR